MLWLILYLTAGLVVFLWLGARDSLRSQSKPRDAISGDSIKGCPSRNLLSGGTKPARRLVSSAEDYSTLFHAIVGHSAILLLMVWPLSLWVIRGDQRLEVFRTAHARRAALSARRKAAREAAFWAGRSGRTLTRHNLGGQVMVDGQRHDAVSEDGFLEAGSAVVVARREGFNLFVKRAKAGMDH